MLTPTELALLRQSSLEIVRITREILAAAR
jgi:hypothetical protein